MARRHASSRKWTLLAVPVLLAALGCPSPTNLTVGGSVSGLSGTLVLGLGAQNLTLTQNGGFTFPNTLAQGDNYQVVVVSQPATQVCTVAHATGQLDAESVTDVDVTCVSFDPSATYTIQVSVSGLSGTLVLLNNGIDPLNISANGNFTFATPINGGGFYEVTVQSQPAGSACVVERGSGQVVNQNITHIVVTCGAGYVVSGTATYDWVPAKSSAEGGPRLDYTGKVQRPIRRAVVRALDVANNIDVASGRTHDDGTYSLSVPVGVDVRIRVEARLLESSYVADGIAPNHCSGGGWDVEVVDNNLSGEPRYVLQSADLYETATSSANLNAPTVFGGGTYSQRSGAPFAILDTALSEIELVCTAANSVVFPKLKIGWSPNNTTASNSIGTSFYVRDGTGLSRLSILGEANVDTDEYDDHVIAHEFGHFVEDRLYRGDSIGGSHGSGDVLHPSVAFSEGYGNAISGMTFNDPIYVDSSGSGQSVGGELDVSEAPSGNDRGIYSETSVQFLLWSLYENRDGTPNSGSFDRIHTALQDQRTTPALTSAHTFAAYYYSHFGENAESLKTLWGTNLVSPWDALCVGSCAPSGTALDLFDLENELGTFYAATKVYPPTSGASSRDADFWRLYRTLSVGTLSGNNHDNGVGYGSNPTNKWGYVRAYRFVGTGQTVTVIARLAGAQPSTCNTAGDVLDLYVNGPTSDGSRAFVYSDTAINGATAGCPKVTFPSVNQVVYDVLVIAQSGAPSWDMVVEAQ